MARFTRMSQVGARSANGLPKQGRPLALTLLNTFELRCDGRLVALPLSAQRLLAFVALHEHPLRRVYVSGTLWSDFPEERASANLRSALWRIQQPGHRIVETTNQQLRLDPAVEVDVHAVAAAAQRLLDGSSSSDDLFFSPAVFAGELLPDWYDDWVLVERERFRQLSLHALEALAERFIACGRFAEAVEAGVAAVTREPLRESAHRVVIRAHLAEGNRFEAIRQYRLCRDLLRDQLRLAPSQELNELIRGVLTS